MFILIVDDSRTARRLMVELMSQRPEFAGCTIEEASSGVEALAKIKAKAPDVVVADINMPGMDGLKLLKALRTEGAGTRLGFLTADRSASMRDEALQQGADFFLNKGCSIETICSAIFGGHK